MSKWICKECGGGFPAPVAGGGRPRCPWCNHRLAITLGRVETLEELEGQRD